MKVKIVEVKKYSPPFATIEFIIDGKTYTPSVYIDPDNGLTERSIIAGVKEWYRRKQIDDKIDSDRLQAMEAVKGKEFDLLEHG